MRKTVIAALLVVPLSASAQCFGPGGCPSCPEGMVWDDCNHTSTGPGPCLPQCVPVAPAGEPVGPDELCVGDLPCQPVTYRWQGQCVVADALLPPSYQVLGWAGPCLSASVVDCPDIKNQAHRDLYNNALRVHRAWRAVTP